MKFRHSNGYKYTNDYATKSYYKKGGIANIYSETGNWIPYYVKIYTQNNEKSDLLAKFTSKSSYYNSLKVSDWSFLNIVGKDGNLIEYDKFAIKKDKQNKYRIHSVVATYYENDTLVKKTFNGNYKTSLTLKQTDNNLLNFLTINYYTKNDIVSEKIRLFTKGNSWKFLNTFEGKNATISALQKGYHTIYGQNFPITTLNRFQIKTINPNYKIKRVVALFEYEPGELKYYKQYLGYGKTKLTLNAPYKYKNYSLSKIKIYYY